jgi:hypothetical protein
MSAAACLALALLVRPGWAQPEAYSGAEIRARVVDAQTRKPLEGVFVVARWDLSHLMSRGHTILHAMEAVTDANGEFYFPPWGPKPRPTFARLWGGDPRLIFFKPGYEPLTRGNPTAPNDSPVRVSAWHGETIEIKLFRGTLELWTRLVGQVQSRLSWGDLTTEYPHTLNDYWKHYPRTVLAIAEERHRLPEAIRYQVQSLQDWDVTEEKVRAAAGQGKGTSP